jgi:hypothetical protein
MLARQTFLRSFFALFLLLVFGFSMLPKKAVHDLFARHKDRNLPIHDYQSRQFTWAGFNCNCDNLVVESPFIPNHFYPVVSFFATSSFEHAEPLVRLKSLCDQDVNLRGPPMF